MKAGRWWEYFKAFGAVVLALPVVSCGSGNGVAGAGSGTTGCSMNPNCKVQSISSVAYGAGVYVAAGQGGLGSGSGDTIGPWLEVSTDGVSWTTIDSGDEALHGDFQSITYGDHGFVVLDTSSQRLYLSTNGMSWTDVTPSVLANGELLAVDWDGSEYIAYNGGPILESQNGKTWSAYPAAFPSDAPFSIRKVSGIYYALWIGDSAEPFATSSDQVHWMPYIATFSGFPNNDESPSDLIYAGKQFVTVGAHGFIATSQDGTTWTDNSTGNSSDVFLQVAYNGSVYVAVGSCGSVDYSADGTAWKQVTITGLLKSNATCSPGNMQSVQMSAIAAAQGGAFVAIGGTEGLTSMDGIHWTAIKF